MYCCLVYLRCDDYCLTSSSPEIWWYFWAPLKQESRWCLAQEHRLLVHAAGSSLVDILLLHISWACPSHLPGCITSEFAPMKLMPPRAVWTWIDALIPQRHSRPGLHLSLLCLCELANSLDCSLMPECLTGGWVTAGGPALQLTSALFEVASERLNSNYSLQPRADDDCGLGSFLYFLVSWGHTLYPMVKPSCSVSIWKHVIGKREVIL